MKNKRSLDMKHKFIQQIQDNQIDRELYEKSMKAQKERSYADNVNGEFKDKFKKPDKKMYNPPKRKNTSTQKNSTQPKDIVFKLEYEDENGQIHEVMIRRSRDILLTVEEFGESIQMKPSLIPALYSKVLNEYNRIML